MDLSKFKTSDWLKVGGAIGFFLFGFFPWVSFTAPAGLAVGSGGNVFSFFWTGTLPWLLVLGTGAVTVLLLTGKMAPGKFPWPLTMLLATGLAALLLLLRLIINPVAGSNAIEALGGDVGRGFGMILSVVCGLVAFAGALIGFRESGGDLQNLKNPDWIKRQFGDNGKGGGTPPPPPPPLGSTPPPPPPPPPGAMPPPPPPA